MRIARASGSSRFTRSKSKSWSSRVHSLFLSLPFCVGATSTRCVHVDLSSQASPINHRARSRLRAVIRCRTGRERGVIRISLFTNVARITHARFVRGARNCSDKYIDSILRTITPHHGDRYAKILSIFRESRSKIGH